MLKKKVLKNVYRIALLAVCLGASGCPTNGIYSTLTPTYNLTANQDKKILIWVESPRSAAADADAAETLAEAIGNYLMTRAKIRPENVILGQESRDASLYVLQSTEAAALQQGAELALLVRIEDYELLPMNIRNFYSGRMLTRAVLLDAATSQTLWPQGLDGKVHDIVVELGQGNRTEILSRLADGTAHCIVRNLYPIMKLHYKNSDERMSMQEAFELETF